MPTTRHQAQATPPESQQHSSTNNPSDSESPKVTRSGRVIQRWNQDSGNFNPRSAKRRRTESSASLDDADISVAKTTDQLSLKDRIERAANTALEQGRAQDVTDRTNEHVPDGNRVYVSRSDVSNGGTLRTAKPTSWMKRESLPVLDILATQILCAHAKPTHQEVGATIADPTSVAGRSYVQGQSDFARTKQLYGGAALFLRQSDGDLQEPTHTEILRKANLATFISSIFTGHIGLEELDRHFLEVFVPEGGRLLKAQAALWLELKTQAFIASVVAPNKHPPSLVLSTLFNEGIERNILDRRPGAKGLAPSEQDFMERMASRRDFLAAEMSNEPASTLPGKYRWDDFLREITLYIGKTLESVNGVLDNEANAIRSTTLRQRPEMQRGEMEGSFSIHARPSESAVPPAKLPPTPNPQREDFVARAARAAHIALQGPGMAFPSPRPKPPSPIRFAHSPYQQVQPTFQHYTPPSASHGARSPNAPRLAPSDVPHSSQSAPTQVLYERARMATSAKASPSSKKAASASQRRPWTSEEEEALMEGLDRVRGPHWSQILTMFGAGGKENEKLKDRNQVQLKDKARNLKLFFLKSGIEVPFYLQYVTGDLKSRAPAQASKKERERLQGSEDPNISGVEGIVALAQGQEADESGLMAVDEGEASGD